MVNDMVEINLSKYVDRDKLSKFICRVKIEYEDDHFWRFITKERAEKYLYFHFKKSVLRKILSKNPYVVSIVSYKHNHNRKDLSLFFNDALFEFTSMTDRDLFSEALVKGLQQYFEYAQKLYEKERR